MPSQTRYGSSVSQSGTVQAWYEDYLNGVLDEGGGVAILDNSYLHMGSTNKLNLTGFDFDIPANATITGVKVEVNVAVGLGPP